MIRLKPALLLSLLATLILPLVSYAETDPLSAAIHQAGDQEMLSQRIAKAYFFLGENVRPKKAHEQLKTGLELFNKHQHALLRATKDREVHELLSFIDTALADFTALVNQPYTKSSGSEVLILSENLLEVCHSVMVKLQQASNQKKKKLTNISRQQRMLTQRIAKYYIAYQAGFHDPNTVTQLQQAVTEFETALKVLSGSSRNTPQITSSLDKIESLWKVVRKFFLDHKRGGLPVTVFTTTDSIMQEMNLIANMYEQVTPATKGR